MKLAILCLGLGALPGLAGQRAHLAPITLYTQFEQDPPGAVLEALQDELKSIMAPMGITFDWRSLSGDRGGVSVELAVITFRGHCDAAGLPSHYTAVGALGWTHVSEGTILPFAEVECDRIRNFLARGLLAVDPDERDEALGRAIARVMAHELYHILAATPHNGDWGVGKPAYSVHDLLSDEFRFEEPESRALRTSKVHGALVSGAGLQ